jgi:molybdopterin synthase catalytic subunit
VRIELRGSGFNPWHEIDRHQLEKLAEHGKYGATACFVGTMRDFNEGETVRQMTLEHYPGMTEKHLEEIVSTAQARWKFIDALLIHRVGKLLPNEPIVVVVVWASHRGAAFDACRYIMEELKSSAPFWKKETLQDRERWVQSNTAGL